jgi:hypothetical protein
VTGHFLKSSDDVSELAAAVQRQLARPQDPTTDNPRPHA